MADSDHYGKKQSQERFEKALRGALKTPPMPHAPKAGGKQNPEKTPRKKAGK